MPNLTYSAKTDVGRVRQQNQDSVAVIPGDELGFESGGLFVVADGMGGHAGGEVASKIAVQSVTETIKAALADQNGNVDAEVLTQALREALVSANEEVWQEARGNPELRGMGTTCVSILIRDRLAVVGNVGDSRAYLLRSGRLHQLTEDHSLVQEYVRSGEFSREEARVSRYRNVITRAIGIADDVQPDVEMLELREGDTILLCSDGLTNMVPEQQIARALSQESEADSTCKRLIAAANANGGADNITTIVIRHGSLPAVAPQPDTDEPDDIPDYRSLPPPMAPPGQLRSLPLIALTLLVVLLGAALYYTAKDHYTLQASWPILVEKPPPALPKVVPPPAIDFGKLEYGPLEQLSSKSVRSEPMAVDPAGGIFAVTESGKIQRFDGKQWTGDFGTSIPRSSVSVNHWAVDPGGFLYVTSKSTKQIHKYSPAGTRIAVIGKGELKSPESIALDGAGNIYVIDANRLKRIPTKPYTQHPTPNTEGQNNGSR